MDITEGSIKYLQGQILESNHYFPKAPDPTHGLQYGRTIIVAQINHDKGWG